MRVLVGILAILFSISAAFASEIREFSVPTLERLGTELYHLDQIAARAADLVVEQHPKWKSVKPQGWITDLNKNGDIVYLIADTKSGFSPAYKVTFPRNGSPTVQDIHGQSLPPQIATRYKARRTALAALNAQTDPLKKPVTGAYNFEVLDDPERSGFLVYALAASNKPDEIMLGGHRRVSVSADGEKANRVDSLAHSLNVASKKTAPGLQYAAAITSQLVSNKPVETFVYLSYLHHVVISVGTPDGAVWGVANGKIVRIDEKGPKNALDILNRRSN